MPAARPPIRVATWGLALLGTLAACGTYEPPKPGVYREVGSPQAALVCDYDLPTGLRVAGWRCTRTEQMAAASERAREVVESNRVHQPRTP